jgi:hypothetical protein
VVRRFFAQPPKGIGLVSKIEKFTASDLRQAITAFRQHSRVSVYISLSERIGLPLALLLSLKRMNIPHVLVGASPYFTEKAFPAVPYPLAAAIQSDHCPVGAAGRIPEKGCYVSGGAFFPRP